LKREETTVKVHVDPDRCQGHTLCAMIAPDLFQLDDIDGHSTVVIDGDVPADLEAKAAEAVRSCPEQAILVISEEPRA
jgi:ferredoxin